MNNRIERFKEYKKKIDKLKAKYPGHPNLAKWSTNIDQMIDKMKNTNK